MLTAPWQRQLRRLTELPAVRVRLICVPHAGGAASSFLPWIAHVPDSIGLWAVQPPGREDRLTEPTADLMSAARSTAEALQWLTDLPYALFGHSMGALIAYEAARRLQTQRQPGPIHLFTSSCTAPSDQSTPPAEDHLHAAVLAMMHRMGLDSAISPGSDADALAGTAIRHDLEAFLNYHHLPGPPVTCPTTAFVGEDDPEVPSDSLCGWERHASACIETNVFPGGHFYLFDHPDRVVTKITDILSAWIH
jgi:pyochelin biosynthesis protein PchC